MSKTDLMKHIHRDQEQRPSPGGESTSQSSSGIAVVSAVAYAYLLEPSCTKIKRHAILNFLLSCAK